MHDSRSRRGILHHHIGEASHHGNPEPAEGSRGRAPDRAAPQVRAATPGRGRGAGQRVAPVLPARQLSISPEEDAQRGDDQHHEHEHARRNATAAETADAAQTIEPSLRTTGLAALERGEQIGAEGAHVGIAARGVALDRAVDDGLEVAA